ncbi:MAG: SMI1/KNR4 family protein, partial [Nanoarchaeota archaeon]
MKLNNLIKKHKDKFIIKTGVTQKDITDAEKRLKIKFTDELKEYFLEFGALRFLSMELKGLGYQSPNRNIVINTIKARKNASIPKNAVVLEDIGEFHYVIYNNENNNVIYWGNNKEIKIISKSLEKFLIKRIKEEIKNLEKEKKKYNKKTIHFIKNIEKFDKHLNQVIEKSKKEIYKKIKKLSNENPTQKQQIQEVLQDVKEYKMNLTTSFNNLNVHHKKTKKLKNSLL